MDGFGLPADAVLFGLPGTATGLQWGMSTLWGGDQAHGSSAPSSSRRTIKF